MSKARQLADLLDSNGDVVVGALDNAPDPDLTPYARTADLLDGGGNIQSGLLGNAPETDLTPVKQDLGILAFESARSDNRSAFNLPNAFIDQFEDSSGIDTTTNAFLINENVFTAGTATTNLVKGMNGHNAAYPNGGTAAPGGVDYTGYDGVTRPKAEITGARGSRSGSYSSYMFDHIFEPDDDFEVIISTYGQFQGVGYAWQSSSFTLSQWDFNNGYWDASFNSITHPAGINKVGQYHAPVSGDGGTNYYNLYRYARSSGSTSIRYYGRTTSQFAIDASTIAAVRSGNFVDNIGSTRDTSNNYLCLGWGEANGSDNIFRIEVANVGRTYNNTTGNFTGVTQSTSSSVSEMSIVVMYEDNAGTATLNTDLVVQVSANNGTDWTTVNLASAPNLSGSIKVAKSNAVAVTAGTQPKYRINFANQAVGSKVTRILGVALLY